MLRTHFGGIRMWARGEPSSGARVPVERTLAELAHARSLVLSDVECDAGAGASAPATAHFKSLVLDKNDFLTRLDPSSHQRLGSCGSWCRQGMLPG